MSNKNKWQALPMKDRAFLIKLGIQNGITDLGEIQRIYNDTDILGAPYRTFESGSDYDYFNAHTDNMPDSNEGHWSSRNPKTGQLLKSSNHPTYDKMIEGERREGYNIIKIGDREYSIQENKHQYSGEKDTISQEQSTIGKVGSTLYDILEVVDPTGISSLATPEGDLWQSISKYKRGEVGVGNVALNAFSAIPMLGKVGKAIKLAKGVSKAEKALQKGLKMGETVDTLLELIPGVKKAVAKTQAITTVPAQLIADAANAGEKARRSYNIAAGYTNVANTLSDVGSLISNAAGRAETSTVQPPQQESPEVPPTINHPEYLTQDNYLEESAKFREAFEEFKENAYWDEAGKKWTIGTGLTYIIDKNGKEIPVKKGQKITPEENTRQVLMKVARDEEYARSKTPNWDNYHPELKFQIIDAMFNTGRENVWNERKAPNYLAALRQYEQDKGWEDPNYDMTQIFKHADWDLNNPKNLGLRARMRRNPQAINPEDYRLIYTGGVPRRDSLRAVYDNSWQDAIQKSKKNKK